MSDPQEIPFIKMHSIGNDMIVIDRYIPLTVQEIQSLCHRSYGVGCDQLLMLEGERLHIWNQDGSVALACGNGTRCIIELLADSSRMSQNSDHIMLQGPVEALEGWRRPDGQITVIQGAPSIKGITQARLEDHLVKGYSVCVGNPHWIFVQKPPAHHLWQELSAHPAFPGGTNVSFVYRHKGQWYGQTWERGAGLTMGCGSGACAMAAVLWAEKYIDSPCLELRMPGGTITIRSGTSGYEHTAYVHKIAHGFWVRQDLSPRHLTQI